MLSHRRFGMSVLRVLGRALVAWWNDNALRLGASVAYYTLFAIAPILLVAIAIAGTLFGADAVGGELAGQIEEMVGPEGGMARAGSPARRLASGRKPHSATIGVVTGIACMTFVWLQLKISWQWYVLIGSIVTYAAGSLASVAFERKPVR